MVNQAMPEGMMDWLRRETRWDAIDVAWLAGDASPRRYWRVRAAVELGPQRTCVAVDAPQSEKTTEFLSIRAQLEQFGIRVPRCLAADAATGWMLLEDLGDTPLQDRLNPHNADHWYGVARNQICQFVRLEPGVPRLPKYDRTRLQTELDVFMTWFVQALLGYTCTDRDALVFSALSETLLVSAAAQPQVFVHRDYHCRNLMVTGVDELATIDFQDAVWGPITYDAVSIWKDCYIRWPRDQQLGWLSQYYEAIQADVVLNVGFDTFTRWFDLMGLQRHIKVLGVFSRLYLRDAKAGYLSDLPRVLAYVLEALALYRDTDTAVAEFDSWLQTTLMPLIAQQKWAEDASENQIA
jgi:aminoglycoside/choline kinase family phosphotransferase